MKMAEKFLVVKGTFGILLDLPRDGGDSDQPECTDLLSECLMQYFPEDFQVSCGFTYPE